MAGGRQIEQRGVLAAAGAQRDLRRGRCLFGFPGGEVVGGHGVREVNDHRGVLVVQTHPGQPPVPAGAAVAERDPGHQVAGGERNRGWGEFAQR